MRCSYFTMRLAIVILGVAACPAAVQPALASGPRGQKEKILAMLAARSRDLQSFTARYHYSYQGFNNAAERAFIKKYQAKLKKSGFRGKLVTGPGGKFRYTYRLRFLKGWLRTTRRVTSATVKKEFTHGGLAMVDPSPRVRVWTPTRYESLSYTLVTKHPRGTISAPQFPVRLPLLYALGLSDMVTRRWIRPRTISHLGLKPLGKGRWVLTKTSTISVPGVAGRAVAHWTITERPHLAITGFTQRVGGYLVEEVRCSAFRSVGGLALPGTVLAKFWNGNFGLVAKYRLSRIRYRLLPRGNTLARYRIKFPVGARVYVQHTNQEILITKHPSYLTNGEIYRHFKP